AGGGRHRVRPPPPQRHRPLQTDERPEEAAHHQRPVRDPERDRDVCAAPPEAEEPAAQPRQQGQHAQAQERVPAPSGQSRDGHVGKHGRARPAQLPSVRAVVDGGGRRDLPKLLTVKTGQGARRTTFSATLPIRKRAPPVRPWVAITIRSCPPSSAWSAMALAARPGRATNRAATSAPSVSPKKRSSSATAWSSMSGIAS